ncbi:twin transmembrane helix small protein [Acidovorax sp.]|uniref:twin transmembrane helix small protein n=1 Tax=Acidovorax sp. TaxID=1872122 RepID=UPI003919C03A
MKYLVVLAFIGILASLGSALFFMMRRGKSDTDDKAKGSHMARALAVRVGLSIVLFLCILVAWQLGYIQPTGLPASR